MRFWSRFIDMKVYSDSEIKEFLDFNDFSKITIYLRDGKNKQEIIKTDGNEKRIDDDYDNVSFSDKFLQWMTVVAQK